MFGYIASFAISVKIMEEITMFKMFDFVVENKDRILNMIGDEIYRIRMLPEEEAGDFVLNELWANTSGELFWKQVDGPSYTGDECRLLMLKRDDLDESLWELYARSVPDGDPVYLWNQQYDDECVLGCAKEYDRRRGFLDKSGDMYSVNDRVLVGEKGFECRTDVPDNENRSDVLRIVKMDDDKMYLRCVGVEEGSSSVCEKTMDKEEARRYEVEPAADSPYCHQTIVYRPCDM